MNGPFPAGTQERTIFRGELVYELLEDELVETDAGLSGINQVRIPSQGITSKERKQKSNARAQHEVTQGRLKHFNILNTYFHHTAGRSRDVMLNKHGLFFGAIAVITQLKIREGETCFNVDYNVHYS